jgi:hypothetical protein
MNGKAPDADDYNTVIATDAGPKRFNDGENDSGRSTMGDFMRDFLGRN